DRIFVNFFKRDAHLFYKLEDGEMIKTLVHTKSGIKKMYPVLIEKTEHCIIIENAPTIQEAQLREEVRMTCDKPVQIIIEGNYINATTMDLSAGGIRFEFDEVDINLEIGYKFFIRYDDEELPKDLIKAKIIKKLQDKVYVAQFYDNNVSIMDKVAKFCMRNFI
ncbi:PilZ domain-containing protein, partial [bacterium]|nr:PilZ domain-containing protein [bacterium]